MEKRMKKTKKRVWRVTVEAPADWQAKVKASLAASGISLKTFLLHAMEQRIK